MVRIPTRPPTEWSQPLSSEQSDAVEHLVDTAPFSYFGAQCRIVGPPYVTNETLPPKKRPQGSVRDFADGGRADEFRGRPGAPAPGYEDIYARGIAATRAVLRDAELSHPNPQKTELIKAALNHIALARQAGGAYHLFADADTADPRRALLGKYRDSDHAYGLERQYRAEATREVVTACGVCAVTSCMLRGRPTPFMEGYEDAKRRKQLRRNIQTLATGKDFDCSEPLKKK